MKTILLIFAVAIAGLATGCQDTMKEPGKKMIDKNKPAIVLVAFGTSVDRARKVFDYIDQRARERYPNREIRWAFTSSFIRRKLAKRGIIYYSPQEVVDQLKQAGFKQAVFQSLHVAPGQEYKSVKDLKIAGLRIEVGKALLSSDEDIQRAIACLRGDIDLQAVNVIACHGNDKYPHFNDQLVAFAKQIEAKYPGKIFTCSVEGLPGVKPLKLARKQARKNRKVNFIPLMIVAGDHIMNDVTGDEEDSWKSIIGVEDIKVSKPLGYNDCILKIFFDHLDEAELLLK